MNPLLAMWRILIMVPLAIAVAVVYLCVVAGWGMEKGDKMLMYWSAFVNDEEVDLPPPVSGPLPPEKLGTAISNRFKEVDDSWKDEVTESGYTFRELEEFAKFDGPKRQPGEGIG